MLMFRCVLLFGVGVLTVGSYGSDLSNRVTEIEKSMKVMEIRHREQVQSLTDEIANLKTGSNGSKDRAFSGANRVYGIDSGLSIGGYGEMKYKSERGGSTSTDLHRLVPYIGYKFSDNLIFNSEIEFEHGGSKKGAGEAIVEFAYIDFIWSPAIQLRVGHLLIPAGITNLNHEPTSFYGVERPEVEKYIIPTTWHENGILLLGQLSNFEYSVGLVSGFKQSSVTETGQWLRQGRQGGSGDSDESDDFAYVARANYSFLPGALVGGSIYFGDSKQKSGNVEGRIQIGSLYGEYERYGLRVRGLIAKGSIEDGNLIFAGLGEEVSGYYLTVGYDFFSYLGGEDSLIGFIRHSEYDLNATVATGVTRDQSLNRTRTAIGVNYKPLGDVVVKLEYMFRSNEASEENDIVSAGIGFVY